MRRLAVIVLSLALGLQVAAAPTRSQAPDGINHEIEVTKGESQIVKAASGTGGTGFMYDETCSSSSYDNTCEKTLAKFLSAGTAIADVAPSYPSDFDLFVYKSDKDGTIGEEVASSGNFYTPIAPGEKAEWAVKKGEYYVIVVAYFTGGGGYQMTVGVS